MVQLKQKIGDDIWPVEVRAKARELQSIFPIGLIISPSHEAILPDIPPANIEALFQAINDF